MGGTYEIGDLVVGPDGDVVVSAPTLLRTNALDLRAAVRVTLASSLVPEDVRWEVAGGGAVSIGEQAAFVGVLVAPASVVQVVRSATVLGQILAREVQLGPSASATATGAGSSGGQATQVSLYSVNEVNEYTSIGGVARTNDDNGNLTDDGGKLFFYDYKNRLVGVSERGTGNPVATYEYLADGRRAKRVVYSQTIPGQVQKATCSYWDGAQEVEEQDAGSGATEATYVWSPVYVDELVTYTNAAGTFYTHQDARCDVVAITDAAGSVVERVRFDDFGKAEIRGPGGEARAVSAVGCAYGFQGRRLDAETGLLYFRARMYDPATGRFLQRDPVWDAGNVGGQYTFVGNGPVSGRDPGGLQRTVPAGYNIKPEDVEYFTTRDIADIDVTNDYLYYVDYWILHAYAPAKLSQFYANFVGQHGSVASAAAKAQNVPEWLLLAVVAGESIDMNRYAGCDERTLERLGAGDSVGPAQLTNRVAVQRGLTPTARLHNAHPEYAAAAGGNWLPATVRGELLDPAIAFDASARYIRQLLNEAAQAQGSTNPPSTQFGDINWQASSFDEMALSALEGQADVPADMTREQRIISGRLSIAAFIGAAHNDNRVSGQFAIDYGGGQGQYSRSALLDLYRFGHLQR